MIENTIAWIVALSQWYSESEVSDYDVHLGNALAGYIKLADQHVCHFPRPPTKRRFAPRPAHKPKFKVGTYGSTPFGNHALKRSGTTVVPELGNAEREAMQLYVAYTRHRSFTEHIEYGDSFVISWLDSRAAKVVALDLAGDIHEQELEHVRWGDFSDQGMDTLKRLAMMSPEIPVLALHRYAAGRGMWHAVHEGKSITVCQSVDIDNHDSDGILSTDASGQDVILALQGFATTYQWHGVGPSADEVNAYQHRSLSLPMPAAIKSTENENITNARVTIPTYSTEVTIDGRRTFVYIAPEIHSLPENDPFLASRLPSLRGQVIAELATGGYWHGALRGVCFRAFLKGHFQNETLWTGAVLGWRFSSTAIPEYRVLETGIRNVRAVHCLDGIDDPDQLSSYNPDMFSAGVKVVTGGTTVTYDRQYRASGALREMIITANMGSRHMISESRGAFLNFHHGTCGPANPMVTPEDATSRIVASVIGRPADDAW
jgi:hypothetical protein